jgi:hypothetical protein
MKSFQNYPAEFFLVAIVCSFFASAPVRAGAAVSEAVYTDGARLIVRRASDFGTVIFLNLAIDGVSVTTLGRAQGYEAILRPGHHVLSIGTTPSPYGHTKFSHRGVTVKRGHTYAFTALWEGGDRAVLETSRPGDRARWIVR